ncbi:hypothetical protein T265_10592 [Opisthorchis viverrini]|uniref:Reverse transcriptase domain-containing protein n=1 Tax=Opisthorchis viverrini TaxID=6198 RepID=A0A074Z1Q4_OPIVI|nr:hypothetical protein T265_10592 [Opisthorchis viverrini]KER20981.1 hypothetical protein T265_10592 [Opisthorchis viverrini]
MTSVLNTDASLPYNHDLFESLIVKKRIKPTRQKSRGRGRVRTTDHPVSEFAFIMRRTLEDLENSGVQIVCDETYIEYADDIILIFEEERSRVF